MTPELGTIHEALRQARSLVDAVDARILLAHALRVAKEHLPTHPEQMLTDEEAARFHALIERRARGEPVAYLTGRREFYGLEFEVTAAVLIPRPETELLVELALQRIPADLPRDVLDLGTGSGAIAVTLACARPAARVVAIDASNAALDVACRNACRLMGQQWASRLTLLEGEWYAPVSGRRFDLIVANPPYIAAADPHLDGGDLRFEPRQALTPGGDGLGPLRTIAAGAPVHLNPGGWLICEHGYDQAEAVRGLFMAAGLTEISTHADLAAIPRATAGRWPSPRPERS